ncbi:heparinase II/III domain-containing protein [Brachybacterium tyrofermentans]|uniref:heparinase II/III domain-containing protein n=1 Tax=Brachybacterium tyrofermentans TaxID=47848 RepID=UPI001866EE16|nr:heparinase II/III family protein [Brachybacterium tyrofermentans]
MPPLPRKLSVADLDVTVTDRHSFGASYEPPRNQVGSLKLLREGGLSLPPQPVWYGDPTNWVSDPFNDRNWRFQHHTLRWLNPLRWAALGGDDEARAEWVRIVRSWGEANVPASSSGSDFAWKDMADGNRAIQLSLGASFVGSDDDWFVELLEYHRDWLMDESHIVGKNHGLHQHQGLIVLGAALRDTSAIATAVTRMREQFKSSFDHQGTNDEGSVAYHQLNLAWWRRGWERAELEGFSAPEDVSERLTAAGHVLAHFAMPNGALPQIGDSQRGRVGRGYSAASDFVASNGEEGTAPAEHAAVFEGGFITSRSGWGKSRPLPDESHAVIRHGVELGAHSHRDRGSIHIYSAGQPWLVDSGFHSYQRDAPEPKYLKSREAHNVAFLVGAEHTANAPVELVSYQITDDAHDFTLRDHGYGSADVRRRIIYLPGPDCWIVFDSANRAAGRAIRQHWHVEPDLRVRMLDNGYRLAGRGTELLMYWLGRGTTLRKEVADETSLAGWIGTKWKTMQPSTRLVAESSLQRPRLVTLIAPRRSTALGIVSSYVTSAGDLSVTMVRGQKQWLVQILSDELTVRQQ